MDCRYGQDHPMAPSWRRLAIMIQRKILSQGHIMTVNGIETDHNGRQEQYDDPRAVNKLRDGEDQRDNGGGDRAQTVNCQFPSPTTIIRMPPLFLGTLLPRRMPVIPPMTRHPCL